MKTSYTHGMSSYIPIQSVIRLLRDLNISSAKNTKSEFGRLYYIGFTERNRKWE